MIVDEVGSQLESSKINMNSDDEESSDLRSMDMEEINSDSEGEEAGKTSRPKTPSTYVQKEHPKSLIVGDERHGVQTRRIHVGSTSYVNMAMLL